MEAEKINRAYLETLSFSDLVRLADEYGIDVPEDLDRRFLIGELVEVAEEDFADTEDMVISSETEAADEKKLPESFNETKISCILRNPVWAFVFWTVSDSDMSAIKESPRSELILRVCALSCKEELNPIESYEVRASSSDFEQYVLLPKDREFIRVELVCATGASKKLLASSPVLEVPYGSAYLNDFTPGKKTDFPEIIRLSGIEKILMDQYKDHRQSFL